MPLTGREKATIFLSLLGAEAAGRILRYLPDEMADLIAAGINHLPSPSPEALSEVMNEFKSFLALPRGAERAVPQIEAEARPVVRRKTYAFLMYERPQMAAFIVSILPSEQQAEALMSLPRERSVVEQMLVNIKRPPFHAKLEANLLELFKGKLN